VSSKIQVNLSPERVSLGPGETAEFVATIHNTSDVVEAYSVDVQGIDLAWSKLSVTSLSLFPGDKETVRIQVTPPVSSSAKAGSYPVSVRVISKRDPAIGTIASFILDLGKVSDYELALLPKKLKARKGHFQLAITNNGNTVSTYKLEGSDPDDICDFHFKSDTVVVDPGTTQRTPVIVNPRKKPFTGASRSFGFSVKAIPLEGEAKTAEAEFECRPLLPKWAIVGVGIGVVAFIALIVLLARGCGGGGPANPVPLLSSISPHEGNQGHTMDLTIEGHNLTDVTSVSFGAGITVNKFTVSSDTQISANITIAANADPGMREVSVTTPSQTWTRRTVWKVREQGLPAIISISRTKGNQGETLTVQIIGTYFSGVTAVSFGEGITTDSFSEGNAATATILASISISGTATPGARDVSVTTPLGTGSLTGGFTVNPGPPTITSIAPAYGRQGENLTVIIVGTNLSGATNVYFAQSPVGHTVDVTSFHVDSSTQITAQIQIESTAYLGVRTVEVTTPSGVGILTDGFTVNIGPPTITFIVPAQGRQGESLAVIIVGTNFIGATSVSFGGFLVGHGVWVTSFHVDSDIGITVQIHIDAGADLGLKTVEVTTPSGTGSLAYFIVNP
jgi:hypothetical protein